MCPYTGVKKRRAINNFDASVTICIILNEFNRRNISNKIEFFDMYRMALTRNDHMPFGDKIHYLHVDPRQQRTYYNTSEFTGTVGKHIFNALLQFLCPGLK